MAYVVTLIEGVQPSARRGIAFLESDTDSDVNAKEKFRGLEKNQQRNLLSRIDHCLGGNTCDKYFHGWPNDRDRKDFFTFKLKEAGTYIRFYGFLFHPRPIDPRFQVCVLVSHARKNTAHTDPSELSIVRRVKGIKAVVDSVRAAFVH